MFDRIQPKAGAGQLFQHPARPVLQLFRHGMIAEVDVGTHQIIEVAQFIIDLIVPAFAGVIIDDFEYAIFVGVFDVINAVEALIIPDKF